jgi:hypothetical protein
MMIAQGGSPRYFLTVRAARAAGGLTVQAHLAYNAGMKRRQKSIQYTVRAVPEAVDRRLRRMVCERDVSFNTVAVEALEKAVGLGQASVRYRDLDALAGSWIEDPAVERVLAGLDQVDRELWR